MAPQFNLLAEPTIGRGFYGTGPFEVTIIPRYEFHRPFLVVRVHGNGRHGKSWYTAKKVQPVVRFAEN